jgi:hypothetical protein
MYQSAEKEALSYIENKVSFEETGQWPNFLIYYKSIWERSYKSVKAFAFLISNSWRYLK